MKVLVWRGYDVTNVYDLGTQETFNKIKDLVLQITEGYRPDRRARLHRTRTIGELRNWVNEFTRGDDSFDQFEICEVE